MNPPSPVKKLPLFRRIRYLAEYFFVRALTGALSLLPRSWALALGKAVGSAISGLLYSRFAVASKNLKESFPGISDREVEETVRRCWENLGEGLAEFSKMPGMSNEDLRSFSEPQGLEHLEKSYRAGKGVLIFTAHYGVWELGGKFWPASGFETAVIARRIHNPFVNDYVTRVRSGDGARVILAREGVREAIRWLKQGKLLALLIDHRVAEGGLQVPFFGRPALTTSLPAILALRYNIPVHPAHCWREGGKVKIHVAPAMDFSGLGQKEEDIFEATLRMTRVVEGWIRERPYAWLWIHNRWKGAGA